MACSQAPIRSVEAVVCLSQLKMLTKRNILKVSWKVSIAGKKWEYFAVSIAAANDVLKVLYRFFNGEEARSSHTATTAN